MGEISRLYGMIAPNASTQETVRNVFIIDPDQVIRAILIYPLTNGRNIPEILRLLTALQTTDKYHVVTPANWEPGDPALVPPPKTYEELLERQNNPAAQNLQCEDWFWCYRQTGLTQTSPTQTSPMQTSPTQTSPARMSPTETSPMQTSPARMSPTETSPTQTSPTRMSPTETSPTQTGPARMSPTETSPARMSPTETSPARMSLTQTSPTRLSSTQTSPTQVSPTQTNRIR